jgi:hypothetical protein
MVSRSVTLSSFIMALSRRKVRAGGGLPVDGFQLPTDPWPILNCPRLAGFGCPPRGLVTEEFQPIPDSSFLRLIGATYDDIRNETRVPLDY